MQKEPFAVPEITIVFFKEDDIIITSGLVEQHDIEPAQGFYHPIINWGN